MEWIKTIENTCGSYMPENVFDKLEDTLPNLKENLLKFLEAGLCEDRISRSATLMEFGIACLQMFIRENWTGPSICGETFSDKLKLICSEKFHTLASADLQCDGEAIHSLCRKSGLFWIANIVLVEMADEIIDVKNCRLWTVRCLTIYQEIIEEKSSTIQNKFISIMDKEEKNPLHMERELTVQFHLECAHLYLHFYGYSKAKEHLELARSILGIEVCLTGSLGKRTKFQQNELAQLQLDINFSENREPQEEATDIYGSEELPTDVLLDDDTLLTHVKYTDDKSTPLLKPIEQAYILSSCILRQKTTPKDNLLIEEVLPYIQAVVQRPLVWAVQYRALYIRSVLEAQGKRTVERSMMQMECLVNQFAKNSSTAENRTHLLHSIAVPPHWVLQATFARLLLSLGATKSALEVFERIESWEDVISCYRQLGRHEKAENIIRRELEKKETSKLWCLLGDVTGDPEFFEKAWEFSNHRSARAQRSLGFRLLRAGQLKESIPYFQKSVEINSLQPQVWFSLGCAGIATTQFDIAQKAFQRYVNIDPDNHEAWNNLSTVFIKTNQKQKAYKALQEALKANFGNWKIWENFLLVTVDIGEFKDTIRAFHKILELKKKDIDTEVLGILVRSVTSDMKDANGIPASDLTPKVKELFGRITAQITNNAGIWNLYGDLYFNLSEADSTEKALTFYMKAQRCCLQNASWEKDQSEVKQVLEIYANILKATKKIMDGNEGEGRVPPSISSARMAMSSFFKRFDIVYPDGLSDESHSRTTEDLSMLREEFQVLCTKL